MSTCRKGDIVAAEIAHAGKTKPILALARVVSADRDGIAKKIARVSDAVPLEVRAGVRVFTLESFQPEARALFKKSTPHSWQTRDALREAILAERQQRCSTPRRSPPRSPD